MYDVPTYKLGKFQKEIFFQFDLPIIGKTDND